MNRKVKYGIGIIAIMIFCFIYSNVDKMSDMYENKLDNSQYITVQVDEEHAVEQRFHAAEEKVSGIALKIMLQNVPTKGELVYSLKDAQGKELTQGSLDVNEIKSGRVCKIRFEKEVQVEKGKELSLNLTTSKVEEGKAICLYYEPVKKGGTDLVISDESVEGSLILRTFTHRFDVETFVVVLGFVIYIGLFMKVLYKLFS